MSTGITKYLIEKAKEETVQRAGIKPKAMRSFSAAPMTKTSLGLKFLEPENTTVDGQILCLVKGVRFCLSKTDYPTTFEAAPDTVKIVDVEDLGAYQTEEFIIDGLDEKETYYITAFPYSDQLVYNDRIGSTHKASAAPTDGDTVTVTISIDNDVAFDGVTVTCVDETDSTETESVQLTKTKRSHTFIVPIGDTYHIEYGTEPDYVTPANTSSKVSIAGAITSYTAQYKYFTATISATYPAGATVTCVCGGTSYTAPDTSGSVVFTVHKAGTWVLTATNGGQTTTANIEITANGQSRSTELAFTRVHGISRDITSSSPLWTRTDNAVGLSATASVGTSAGSSDFSSRMPWSGMTRETLSTGDVMVKIPKFWYRRYRSGNTEYIKIADGAKEGFSVHPAFLHNGKEQNHIYVGAYKTSSGHESLSAKAPLVSQTRSQFRSGAAGKGSGWSQMDISTLSAIQMLFLVEFATNNSQGAIGRGYVDSNSAAISTGSCNSVPGLTGRPAGTDGKVDVVYRGIEGIWGNVYEWVDGINTNVNIYICNDQTKFADDTATNYTALGYTGSAVSSGAYTTKVGLDTNHPHVMAPVENSGGSETTYFCDYGRIRDSWRCPQCGGNWADGSVAGLFYFSSYHVSSNSSAYLGSRLLYIPA